MPFTLSGVVPWGRNLEEYKLMFRLSNDDMSKKIADFGGGPASFNCELTEQGGSVISFDPVYGFTENELRQRINEVRGLVMEQMRENRDNYVWTKIKSLNELESVRMSAMNKFLSDFEQGKSENRYICHELPDKLNLNNNTFDIGLSSHFLLMYTSLGYDFHIRAISEMLRVCREIRIFPLVDLNAEKSNMITDVIGCFRKSCHVEIVNTDYEFQKGANKLLIIKNEP